MTMEHLRFGSFHSVPSVKLLLTSLSKRSEEPLPWLERDNFVDLQKAMSKLPKKFLQNLHSALKAKTLEPHRQGEWREVVERLEMHFNYFSKMRLKVKGSQVPLVEMNALQDPQVIGYLKHSGVTECEFANVRKNVKRLFKRHKLYAGLYSKFSRLQIAAVAENVEEDGGNEGVQEVIEVLDSKQWERYLKDIDPERSILTLRSALDLARPLPMAETDWL